jgi:hypothetical protein
MACRVPFNIIAKIITCLPAREAYFRHFFQVEQFGNWREFKAITSRLQRFQLGWVPDDGLELWEGRDIVVG